MSKDELLEKYNCLCAFDEKTVNLLSKIIDDIQQQPDATIVDWDVTKEDIRPMYPKIKPSEKIIIEIVVS